MQTIWIKANREVTQRHVGQSTGYWSLAKYDGFLSSNSTETCSTVSSPANGAVSMSQQGSTTMASFTCDVGYSLAGDTSITCLISGTWSSTPPTCGNDPSIFKFIYSKLCL